MVPIISDDVKIEDDAYLMVYGVSVWFSKLNAFVDYKIMRSTD